MPCRADETSWAHCCAAQPGMLLCGPSAPLALARWADLQLQHAIDRRLGCAVRFSRRCMTTALQRLVLDKTPRPGHPKTDGPASLGFGAGTASQCLSASASVAASRRTGGRFGHDAQAKAKPSVVTAGTHRAFGAACARHSPPYRRSMLLSQCDCAIRCRQAKLRVAVRRKRTFSRTPLYAARGCSTLCESNHQFGASVDTACRHCFRVLWLGMSDVTANRHANFGSESRSNLSLLPFKY